MIMMVIYRPCPGEYNLYYLLYILYACPCDMAANQIDIANDFGHHRPAFGSPVEYRSHNERYLDPLDICLLCGSVFYFIRKRKARPWTILASVVGLTLVYVCCILVLATDWMTADMAMDNLYWIFFGSSYTIYIVHLDQSQIHRLWISSPKSRNAVILIALFLSITLICIFPYYSIPGDAGKVVIYERDS